MISVLTLVKNRESHLCNLMEGLRRSVPAPAELVIVDMSDTPIARPECDFPVSVLRLDVPGLPLARARNLAAAHARSDRFLFLDVDCIPAAGLCGAMNSSLLQNDALICAEVLYLGAGGVGESWTETGLRATGMRHPARDFPGDGLRREANAGLFWSLAFGVARATFHRIGGFDESFTGYGAEDTDFSFAAREAGLELLFLGGPGAFHQHHGVSDPPLQHFSDIVRNAEIFHRKWGVWPMEGWLARFRDLGLIAWTETSFMVRRQPTEEECLNAARAPDARY
ncbi:glycosyltransferase family 2 protein [Bosea sp. PAMC 26642]|uniref:glycosyltransferase family 2 protein n=1 Tax=Bosea sp. (strain PAMC 26642) TaxID=1792307 RepID=UPI000AD3C319|nr:glycosyltransferase [Bosea sp. PAMC 26642]